MIGVISSIIAVVSILGDHLEDIGASSERIRRYRRGRVRQVHGRAAKRGQLHHGTVCGRRRGKCAGPVAGRPSRTCSERDAGAAFDGLTTILQSVMGVVGQIVSFAQTTVKPIIQDIFSFLTGTVVPIILQTFTAAAPSIAGIISGLGSAIMTAMQIIGSAIQAVMPIVQSIITVIMSIASVVVPAVLAGISALAQGIGPILEGIKTVFDGLIAFITGVFTGNWSQAWEGVKADIRRRVRRAGGPAENAGERGDRADQQRPSPASMDWAWTSRTGCPSSAARASTSASRRYRCWQRAASPTA